MIAIQPPAYFPPLAYTALIGHVDHFILADTFRYRSETFQNRSKLRNAQGGHWITIPLISQPDGAAIETVEIDTGGRWRDKHWRSFLYDYRSTMYFEYYVESFRPFFEVEWTTLADCVCRSVTLQMELMGLTTPVTRASTLDGRPRTLDAILETTTPDALAVPESASSPQEAPVPVETVQYEHPTYRQNFEGFEPGMTALDLLFNYGREAPRRMMRGLSVSRAA